MAQCRFCKREIEVDNDGLCQGCKDEGITVMMKPYQLLIFIVIIAGVMFGAILGLYWLFSNFPLLLGVSYE